MSERLLEQKVRQLFSGEVGAEVLRILERYRGPERVRVQLAVLKCAGNDSEQVRARIEQATQDYRDILASAEYPRQMSIPASEFAAMPPREKRALLQADRDEYRSWLDGGSDDDDEPS
jgi:hypothetical protein